MKIVQAEYITSGVKIDQYPTNALPEIALAGRSNVGKSSLINALLGRKNLARTSGKPGKTQTINFYEVNQQLYLADVPGYGFARVPHSLRQSWGRMMDTYFRNRKTLRAVIQIVDVRHAPSVEDVEMYQYLLHLGITIIVVATKADKIVKGKWQKHLSVIRKSLEMPQEAPIILFSAETKQGKEAVWAAIKKYL